MRLPVSLGWKAGLLLLALAIQLFAHQASSSVNAQAIPDVGVTGIELPTGTVNQGDTADIKVTIENLGSSTASVLVVLWYLDVESTPGSVGQMMQDVAAGRTAEASFSWNTTEVPLGSYTFQAVALSDGIGDDNPANDFLISTDAVTIVAQAIPDVGVTGIQVPTDPVSQGDVVEIDVTVQNLGSATASVTVTLLDTTDPGQVAEKTKDIDADATEVVTLAWDTTEASLGNHTLRAVAVVEGDTNVDNDSLLSTDVVNIVAPTTTDVGVTGIQVPTDPVSQGDVVEIDVTVQNLGSATASVTVTLLDTTDPSQIAEKTEDIDADAAKVVTLSWDTTDASLGNHTLRAVAVVEGDTNVDNDSLLSTDAVTIVAPTTTDVGVTGIQVPTDPVSQGDIAEIAVTVQNLGSATASVTVTLLDTTDPGQVAEKTKDIDADATEVVTLAWDTTEASLGNHTLRAVAVVEGDTNVDNDSLLSTDVVNIVAPTTTDVGVTGIQVPTDPVTQGDIAEIDVTVQNLGSATASVTVTLLDTTDPGQVAEKTKDIDADATEVVTLAWDTTEASLGNHTLRAVAVVEGDTNVDNDSLLSTDVVTIVAPTTTDVGVTGIQVPTDPVSQGDIAEIAVTVQNLGSATASVTVTLLDTTDPGQVAEKTKDIDADATEVVTLAWDTTEASLGNHTLRAVAVVEEDTNVDNDSLLSTDAVNIVAPVTYGVSVTAVNASAGPVTQGGTVSVDVTVENTSSVAAMFAVTLLYIPAKGEPGIAAEKPVAISAGASVTVTLLWDTSDATPGAYTISGRAMLVEDQEVVGFMDAGSTITINGPVTYGVAVASVNVPTEISTGQVTQGDVVSVNVGIENRSSVTAMFAVTLFYQLADGQEEEGIAAEETFEITPGFTKGASLLWDTAGVPPGVYKVGAKVMLVEVPGVDDVADSLVAEMTPFTISAPVTYGVAVTAVDGPAGPAAQGETVDVDVTIENRSSVPAMFAVTLFYHPADGQADGQEVTATEETVEIDAGAIETVTLNWDTSGATPDVYTIRAKAVLVRVAGVDDVTHSLVAATPLTVSAPVTYGVAITGIDVPDGPAALGAEVAVDVTVENLGNTEVNAEVTLLYQPDRGQGGTADEKTVQIVPGASVTITLSWDTSGVMPGVHTFRAGVTLVEDSDARDFLDSASTITVVSGRIIPGGDRGLHFPDASFGGTLAAAPVETTPSLVTRFLIFGGFAKGYKTSSPVIETSLVPHDKLFTTNAQATFGSGLQNPFELGEIRVTVHLEERPNSLGAYVMVGSQTFFADANGNCRIVVPSGFYDLAIQAPGYVSARIPGVRLGIGEAVTVPELTLPFGDSNGDGLIDILDLSVAAGNFGATIHEISLP